MSVEWVWPAIRHDSLFLPIIFCYPLSASLLCHSICPRLLWCCLWSELICVCFNPMPKWLVLKRRSYKGNRISDRCETVLWQQTVHCRRWFLPWRFYFFGDQNISWLRIQFPNRSSLVNFVCNHTLFLWKWGGLLTWNASELPYPKYYRLSYQDYCSVNYDWSLWLWQNVGYRLNDHERYRWWWWWYLLCITRGVGCSLWFWWGIQFFYDPAILRVYALKQILWERSSFCFDQFS